MSRFAANVSRGHFRNVTPPDLAAKYHAAGWWGDTTLAAVVAGHASSKPDAAAYHTEHGTTTSGAVQREVQRARRGAGRRGHGRGGADGGVAPRRRHRAHHLSRRREGRHLGRRHRCAGRSRRCAACSPRRARPPWSPSRSTATANSAGWARSASCRSAAGAAHRRPAPRRRPDGDVLVEGEPIDGRRLPPVPAERGMGPDDLFMMNSTSGTTGMPKCVCTPEPVVLLPPAGRRERRPLPSDVFSARCPRPSASGCGPRTSRRRSSAAPTVLRERFDADGGIELIEGTRVTVLACVSTQFVMMLNSQASDGPRPEQPARHVHRRRGGTRSPGRAPSRRPPGRRCCSSSVPTRPGS